MLIAFLPAVLYCQNTALKDTSIDFYGDSVTLQLSQSTQINYTGKPSQFSIQQFYNSVSAAGYQPVINALLAYKMQHQPNDWLYYQLIRRVANQISPKAENYCRYTLYKWFLLVKSGYDARLATGSNELLLYVLSSDNIYDIPFYMADKKQYVCLNYHDYGHIDFTKDTIFNMKLDVPGAENSFSYAVTKMPDFRPADYTEKDLRFNYHEKEYLFKVMLNPKVQYIFANYPVVDFGANFNIPLSKETYSTLVPVLIKAVHKMSQQQGVDFLMRFTRFAFLYETDQDNFGKEKHMSPEETLLYSHSDCDDRVALFFYLVKEIYNLPMITLLYPTHVTIAVKFDKPVGEHIVYNGSIYSVCDPTPQTQSLGIGEVAPKYKNVEGKVVYAYEPVKK